MEEEQIPRGEGENKKALAEPGQHRTNGRDASSVACSLAPLNALAQAAAEAEGRTGAKYGKGARNRRRWWTWIKDFHLNRVACICKGPGAERTRRCCESQQAQLGQITIGEIHQGLEAFARRELRALKRCGSAQTLGQ